MGSMSMDRMGSGLDRMAMSGMDRSRSYGGYGQMGGALSDRGFKAGCQIFVRNVRLPFKYIYDFTSVTRLYTRGERLQH